MEEPSQQDPIEHTGRAAVRRLAELGLSEEGLARAALRADAEALLTTNLDPPNMEGMTRWGRMVRFLREEVLPQGWETDNSNNFCRTIAPSGKYAIVVSSGDANTGVEGAHPTTKYRKGETAARAVAANYPSLFTLEELGIVEEPVQSDLRVWFLLFRITHTSIILELSDPIGFEDGLITRWAERILIPEIDRGDYVQDLPEDDDGEGYDVEVTAL